MRECTSVQLYTAVWSRFSGLCFTLVIHGFVRLVAKGHLPCSWRLLAAGSELGSAAAALP